MQDWLAVLKWLPVHLLLSQLALSSLMSKGRLLNDLFPLMLFPVAPAKSHIPLPLLLLSVVLASMLLLVLVPVKVIPPKLSLATLLTTVLLLLLLSCIVSLTSLWTRSLSAAPFKKIPREEIPGSRTTLLSSFHWLEDESITKPKLKNGQLAVTVVNFTKEPAELSARKPIPKLLIVPEPRMRTIVSGTMGVPNTWIPLLLLHVPDAAVPLMVWPFRCNVTALATMSIPSTPDAHGPTSVPRVYSPDCIMTTGHVLCVMVVPAFAGE